MPDANELKAQIREMLIQNLMLQVSAEEITDETPLFGEGLGLDSVDALQIVVALDKQFGLKIKDPEFAKFNIVLKKNSDGSMALRREPIAAMRADLQEIITAEAK